MTRIAKKRTIALALLFGCVSQTSHAECVDGWNQFQILEDGEEHIGTLTTTLVSGNCGISQAFTSPDGSFSFHSLGHAGENGVWVEAYVFSNGRVVTYRWRDHENGLVLERLDADNQLSRRLRIYSITANSYHVSTEDSEDGGATWRQLDLVRTVRQVAN